MDETPAGVLCNQPENTMKLADHRNDFFATRQSVAAALEYANEVCSALPDQAAMIRTVLHVVLNSAIATHKDEISQIVQRHAELAQERTDPLTEQIRQMVRAEVDAVIGDKMDAVIGDKTQECIEEWSESKLDSYLESKMEEWVADNLDLGDAVKTYIDDEIDWDDVIGDKIHSYFRNNSFSIEAR